MPAITALALILACVGAGWAILAPPGTPSRPRIDGIAGLTGLAALTALAGWIVLFGAYSVATGWGLLAIGGVALLVSLGTGRLPSPAVHREPRSNALPIGAIAIGLVTLALALGRIAGELVIPFEEPWDDWPSYWHFPRLLLESGGFVEPFNLRRVSALGAAQFAQSYFWPAFHLAANGMTDAVLGQLLLWAVVRAMPNALCHRRQPAWVGEALALAALLISITIPSPSSQPTLLPMAGAVGLLLLTHLLTARRIRGDGLRAALAWGLVAAWLIGLRTSNVVFPAGFWLVSAIPALWHKDREQGMRLTAAGVATALALLPWCFALWHSSGTLYPLIAGNYRFVGDLYSVPLDGPGLMALVADRLWTSRVWIIAALGLVAAFRPGIRLLSVQVVVALVLLVAVSAAVTSGLDAYTIQRLCAPYLAAGVVYVMAALLLADAGTSEPAPGRELSRWDFRPPLLWAGVALWFVMPVTIPADDWQVPVSNRSMFTYQVLRRLNAAAGAWQLGGKLEELHREPYEAAQALLPPDAHLLSITERPYLFRYDKQVVHTLEFLGVVSPAPGMPFFRGPEALASYLRELGYTHLAFTPALFARMREPGTTWQSRIPELWDKAIDFMANTERLERTYPIVYRAPELVVIDLRQAD